MKHLWYKTPLRLTRSVATVLSVAFLSLIAAPAFLHAVDPKEYHAADSGGSSDNPDQTYRNDLNSQNTPEELDSPDKEFLDSVDAQAKAEEDAAKATKTLADKQAGEELAKAFECGFFNPKGCVAAMMDMVMWVSARTLWIAGVLFNITVDYTLNLNTLLTQLPIVDIGWKILRDLANIVFIFIALWAGISITLGIGDEGRKAWGLLAEMVLVALFINFSLFIAKAVVDVSNVAALHFYSLIVPAEGAKKYDSGLAEAYLYGLKLSTLYNSKQIGSGEISANNSMIASVNKSSNKNLSFTNIILIGYLFFGSDFSVVFSRYFV